MKENIEEKIAEIVSFIISKPVSRVTLDDCTILAAELRDLRFRESQEDNGKRLADLMAAAFPAVSGIGNVK